MPIEQPPHIRGKYIVDGEITSRKIATDLQSDNYDPGFSGWLISRVTGNVEFNEGTFRGNVAIAGNLEVSGDDGVLIYDGGDLTVSSGGNIIINGGQLVAGSTVLDASGLQHEGGVVQAVWFDSGDDGVVNASLTTTLQEVCSVTIDPPDWVEQVTVFAFARATLVNGSGGNQTLAHVVTLDDGGSGEDVVSSNQGVSNGFADNHALVEEVTLALSPAGRSIVTTQEARVLTGTNSNNTFGLKVLVIGVRSSFV